MKQKILIVEDEYVEANYLEIFLEKDGYAVTDVARSVRAALILVEKEQPDLVLVDIFLQGDKTGIDLGSLLKERGIPFLYTSANSNKDTLAAAKRTEPYGFLLKPYREKDVLVMVEIAFYLDEQKQRLREQTADGAGDFKNGIGAAGSVPGIIGRSAVIQQLIRNMCLVAPTEVSVLITGETGTGKERIAEAIHELSEFKDGPLVKVNCATLPETMIESILFGHEKGAFTGAIQRHVGKFEQAQHGTIFLDEIAELPLALQPKLLRALQEREIERLGGDKVIKINCRILVATNRNLEEEVAGGRFRMDLFYRLNVFPLISPPLRERQEDIPELANHFIELCTRKLGRAPVRLTPAAMDHLCRYRWPGNVRELEHLIERAVLLTSGEKVTEWAFADVGKGTGESQEREVLSMEENERRHIRHVLKICRGQVSGKGGAAELLQMHPSTLNSRMRKLGIRRGC